MIFQRAHSVAFLSFLLLWPDVRQNLPDAGVQILGILQASTTTVRSPTLSAATEVLCDMDWWLKANRKDWREVLNRPLPQNDKSPEGETNVELRACTFAGRPFGDDYLLMKWLHSFRGGGMREKEGRRRSLR